MTGSGTYCRVIRETIQVGLRTLLPSETSGGSFSIKAVLPALVKGQHWSDLAIADGMSAAVAYESALADDDLENRGQVFADLRTYCAQDTRAMVDLLRELKERAVNGP